MPHNATKSYLTKLCVSVQKKRLSDSVKCWVCSAVSSTNEAVAGNIPKTWENFVRCFKPTMGESHRVYLCWFECTDHLKGVTELWSFYFAERLSDLQLHSLLSMNHLVKYRQFICCNDGSSCDSTYLDKYSLHGAFYLSSLWCWCPHSLIFSCPWGGWLVFKHKTACQPLIYPTFCFSLKLQDYKCIILI